MTSCDYCSGTRSLSDQPALGPCVCAPWSRVEHLAPGVTLYCGDSLEVLPALVDRHTVASVVTDPPYGLGAHPDPRELLRCWLEGRPYAAKGAGFMGKEWDAFVPGPEIWRPVMDLLPPGGHMLAAFGTRTYDLGTLAVRLADAEIRDCIAWVYASGFPKSLNVALAIDKAAGAAEVRGSGFNVAGQNVGLNQNRELRSDHPDYVKPEYATDAARQWEGWGTALKPALEPWVLARKPLAGTVAANILAHGVGALNIDACRVETDDGYATNRVTQGGDHFSIGSDEKTRGTTFEPNAAGRWPANLCHDGSDEVLAGFPVAPGQLAKASTSDTQRADQNVYGDMVRGSNGSEPRNDTGSAARFFYCAKASKRDRDEGNVHPTVKPEALMAYLCRLITPPGGTVLDPFMGSGSTGKAAVRAGFGFVGIERDPAYFEIALRRVRAALDASVTTCDEGGQDRGDNLMSDAVMVPTLRDAAQAVVDRWETPLWKDVEPTAHVIARLRQALAAPPPPSVSIDKGSRPQEAVPTEQAETAVVAPEKWEWWASRDEENYTVGPEGSRADVVAAALCDFDGEPFHVVEACKGSMASYLPSGRRITEWMQECADDNGAFGEDQYCELTGSAEDIAAAEADATAVLADWLARNAAIFPTPWAFRATRNAEWISPAEVGAQALTRPQPADGCSSNEGAGA